ncbi:MAG: site-2 protease family protein [Acidimicrobiales bacterium]
MGTGSRWGSALRRRRASSANIAIAALVIAIVVVAVTKGVQSGKLSLAIVIVAAVAIPSIMFHEVCHGIVAYWCGDDTAKRAGRLSANPARHVDPIGTIVLPIALVLLHAPVFGWAKPVPVALNRLRHPRNQAVLVGLAGPASNALLAIIAGVAVHFIMATNSLLAYKLYYSIGGLNTTLGGGALYWLGAVVGFLGLVNVFIGAFNLLPIPPLDGSSLIERFIPVSALPTYYRMRMAFLVVVFLFVFLDRGFLGTMYLHLTVWYLNLFAPSTTLVFH